MRQFQLIIKLVFYRISYKTKYLEPLILHKSNLSEEKKNLYKKFGIENFISDDKKYFFKIFLIFIIFLTLYFIYYLMILKIL